MKNSCIVCGKSFEAGNKYWKKYCKQNCVQAMWALRHWDLKCLQEELKRRAEHVKSERNDIKAFARRKQDNTIGSTE